ncbi:TetR/AcrR family transcriptional regulator [Demequina sp. EGI L300058]|uniref:TetR/AcrR family transcriptional regulator n=1 Tax=Demequina muriae TaxID=3051664 RepID=A0ABT8GGB4_9MICO|nr:TetR/AcrR family transcriptional regulator [Demequina sp. EGI L300058]
MGTERQTESGRGPYAKSAQVKQRIVKACIEVFTAAGYHGATMADVARSAGISHTGLLHHFPTKLSLLVAALEYGDRESAQYLSEHHALEASADPLRVLRDLTDALVKRDETISLVELDAVIAGEATSPEHPAHGYLATRFADSRGFYVRVYDGLRRSGHLRPDADTALLATSTIALIQGLRIQWLYDREGVDTVAAVTAFLKSHIPDVDL